MLCGKCGAPLPEGAQFCAACGTPVLMPKHTAGVWKRLLNYIIDGFIGCFLSLFVWVSLWGIVRFMVSSGALSETNILVQTLYAIIPILIALSYYYNPLYYIFFESIWQRTPAKWITGTKVVRLDGTKPGFWSIVGRSFARWIPFEWVSFLLGEHPYGWHDQLSKTMVVPAEYSAQEVAAINPKDKGKTSAVAIVVAVCVAILFIIAIIGILAGIVLASLGSARSKGSDAKTMGQVISLRSQAEIYSIDNGSYSGFCQTEEVTSVKSEVPALTCDDSEQAYAISAPLTTGKYWCVDSTLASRETSSDLGTATQCPNE